MPGTCHDRGLACPHNPGFYPQCVFRWWWCGPPSFVGVTLYELVFLSNDTLRYYSCRRFDFKSSRPDRSKAGRAEDSFYFHFPDLCSLNIYLLQSISKSVPFNGLKSRADGLIKYTQVPLPQRTPLSKSSRGILQMRSMAIVTTTRYGAVRVTLPYSVPSDGMPCVPVRVQSTLNVYSGYQRHQVNPRQEGHAQSDKSPQNG